MKHFSKMVGIVGAMVVLGGLDGCVTGECLEYRDQVVNREVCDRYSNTGVCAARCF